MNNRYFNHGCPAIIQDGRIVTNYTKVRVLDQFIRTTNKLDNIHDYKNFLQTNAETIIKRERDFAEKQNTCNLNGQCADLGNKDNFSCMCDC